MKTIASRLIFLWMCIIGYKVVGTNFSTVYVASGGSSNVTAINASNDEGTTLSSLYVGDFRQAGGIVTLPNSTRVYFARDDGGVRVYNVEDNGTTTVTVTSSIATYPHALAATNDKVFVGDMTGTKLSVIDTSNHSVSTISSNVGSAIRDMAVANGKLYVTTESSGVLVYNATTNAFITSVPGMTSSYVGIAASPDESRIYVANRVDLNRSVHAIDTSTDTEITSGGFPASGTANMAYQYSIFVGFRNVLFTTGLGVAQVSDSLTKIYLCERSSNRVRVINAGDGSFITNITVGTSPMRVAISSDGQRAYVTNYDSNTVSIINTVTDQKITDVAVGGHPLGVTYRTGVAVPVASITNSTVLFNNGIVTLITLLATVSDGNLLTFSSSLGSITQPSSGGNSQEATLSYTPSGRAQETGFTFKATNDGNDSNTVTVTLVPEVYASDVSVT